MNLLLEKYLDFKELDRYEFEYMLEDGRKLTFIIRKNQFPHLIGIHKLVDIPIIERFNDPNDKRIKAIDILSSIRNEEELTDQKIKDSLYFSEIENRYANFSKEKLLSLSFTDVIVDFDSSKIKTKLKSKYIFFEKVNNTYTHLGILYRQPEYVPETFFEERSDYYIKNQKILKVNRLRIYDSGKNLILEEYPNGAINQN